MKKRAAALLAAMAFALTSCAPPTSTTSAQDADAATLNVLAASSTRVINEKLTQRAGQLEPPVNLSFDNGGSSDLVSKLREGAPADLLLTASKKTMDKAVQDGTVATPEVLVIDDLRGDIAAGYLRITEHKVAGAGKILQRVNIGRVSLRHHHDHDIGGKHLRFGDGAIFYCLVHGFLGRR